MTSTSGKAKNLEKVKTDVELEVERLKKQLKQKETELERYQNIEKQRKEKKIVAGENDTVSPDYYIEVTSMCPNAYFND
jgi:TolA-binding protein